MTPWCSTQLICKSTQAMVDINFEKFRGQTWSGGRRGQGFWEKKNVEKKLEDASNLSGKKKVKSLKHVFYEIQIFPKWFGWGLIKVFAICICICYLDANVCLYIVKPHLMRWVPKPRK